MGWRTFFSLLFIIFALALLIVYWFVPYNEIEFNGGFVIPNSNFSLNPSKDGMQFYENMRYASSEISYRIDDCTLQKKDDMERAFQIIGDQTILNFYPVIGGEEISVTCDSRNKIEGGLFIAGEGGPSNITIAGDYNVISQGSILLLRDSTCSKPNIALHELLHALGFAHSLNRNNIMYNISKCSQIVGEDIFMLINDLYVVDGGPDLQFQEATAIMRGKYLDANISVRNMGLKDSQDAKLNIYVDNDFVKEVELEPIKVGAGRSITLKNIWVSQINVRQIKFVINSSFVELDKENNVVILELESN